MRDGVKSALPWGSVIGAQQVPGAVPDGLAGKGPAILAQQGYQQGIAPEDRRGFEGGNILTTRPSWPTGSQSISRFWR